MRVFLTAALTVLLISSLAPSASAQTKYTLRVSAQEEFKRDLEAGMAKAYEGHPELVAAEEGFRYFVSLIGMPIVQDESGDTLGFAVSCLVVSPLDTETIVSLMPEDARNIATPLLNRAHNLLHYKLFIMRKENLQETCARIAEATATAIATEEARRASLAE